LSTSNHRGLLPNPKSLSGICGGPEHVLLVFWVFRCQDHSTIVALHRLAHSFSSVRRYATLVAFSLVKEHASNKIDNVQPNILTRLRNSCCHWTLTMRPLCAVYVHVAVSNIKPPNFAMKAQKSLRSALLSTEYFVLLSTTSTYFGLRVKCPILTKSEISWLISVQVSDVKGTTFHSL